MDRKEVYKAIEKISQNENLQITFRESGTAAVIVGGCTFVGSVLGGPVGIGIGGVLGSVCAYLNGKGKYKSVITILSEMSDEEREKLIDHVMQSLRRLEAERLVYFTVTALTNDAYLYKLITNEIVYFLKNNMIGY